MPRLSKELNNLIAILRALNMAYHHAHVKASGPTFAGDHALLQRLYFGEESNGAPILEIDSVMERVMGLEQDGLLDPTAILEWSSSLLDDHFQQHGPVNWRGLMDLEVMLQAHIAEMGEDIETNKTKVERRYRDGLLNLLQDIADRHQTNVYLLQQRIAAPKTAGLRRRPRRRRRRLRTPGMCPPRPLGTCPPRPPGIPFDSGLWMPSWFRGSELP